jgi:hypothetical protein
MQVLLRDSISLMALTQLDELGNKRIQVRSKEANCAIKHIHDDHCMLNKGGVLGDVLVGLVLEKGLRLGFELKGSAKISKRYIYIYTAVRR